MTRLQAPPRAGEWVESAAAADTVRLGEWAGRKLAAGDALCLTGDIGSGKTTFTKGLAKGFGLRAAVEDVVSPTFVLIKEYPCRAPLYHVDLYRLESLGRTERGLLEECLASDAATVIEWGQRAGGLLPGRRLDVEFRHEGGDRRRIRLVPRGGFPWPGA